MNDELPKSFWFILIGIMTLLLFSILFSWALFLDGVVKFYSIKDTTYDQPMHQTITGQQLQPTITGEELQQWALDRI